MVNGRVRCRIPQARAAASGLSSVADGATFTDGARNGRRFAARSSLNFLPTLAELRIVRMNSVCAPRPFGAGRTLSSSDAPRFGTLACGSSSDRFASV